MLPIRRSVLLSKPNNAAKVYYVDATGGNDANTGLSQAAAWKTVAKVNASTFLPGESVLLKRGETWAETLLITWSGTAAKPITFGDYSAGALPILRPSSAAKEPIKIDSKSDIVINNIDCDGTSCQYACNCQNVIRLSISGCTFRSAVYDGLIIIGVSATCTDITVTNCTAHHNLMYGGISVTSTTDPGVDGPARVTISGCTAYSNGVSTSRDHGIYIRCTSGPVTVQDCVSYSNLSCGLKCRNTKNVTVQRVKCYSNNYGFGFDHGSIDGCELNTIKNCLAYSNTVGFYISMGTTAQVNYVYHNTTANNSLYEIQFDSAANGMVFENNIISAVHASSPKCVRSGAYSLAACTFNYNLYKVSTGTTICGTASGTQTWAQWKALGFEANGINADPVFVTNYTNLHIQTTSPAKNAGANLGVTSDYDLVARSATPAMGAYEFV